MFCDPIHGGNVDMVGWQLIGFPGPRMSNFNDIDTHYGEAFRPKPVSLNQVTANPARPSEEETSGEGKASRRKTQKQIPPIGKEAAIGMTTRVASGVRKQLASAAAVEGEQENVE